MVNGKFIADCGSGEYNVYISIALRNKAFRIVRDFVSSSESSEYAIIENSNIFKNFKENTKFKLEANIERIFDGFMLRG